MEQHANTIKGRPASMGGATEWTETARTGAHFPGDVDVLAEALRRAVRGEVRFDGGSRALYSTDASNYRQVPLGVVVPEDVDDLTAAMAVCRRLGAPVVPRGGGTSLAGQSVNVAVVMDCSKYLGRVLEVNPEERYAWVEPGVYLDQLRRQTEPHHLTYAPDPSTHAYCTFGGMIGNNSCGIHSQLAGTTADNVEELEVLTYDGVRLRVGPATEEELEEIIRRGGRKGEIYGRLRALRDRYAALMRARYPDIPRAISGYNLDALLPENGFHVARALVGSEGTCALTLKAKVRLVPWPKHRTMLVAGYRNIYEAGDDVARIAACGPIGLEGMDAELIRYMKIKDMHLEYLPMLPEGQGFLIAEFGGETPEEASGRARSCMEMLEQPSRGRVLDVRLLEDRHSQEHILMIRESGLGATAHIEEESWPGWEDSAVPPERIGDYMRDLRALYDKYGYEASLYGHFGQGCVHTRINFDLRSADGIRTYRAFLDEASDLCIRYGGSLSAEHGDGQARAELLPKLFGAELVQAFRDFKEIWDPAWKLNPGKVVDPYRTDDNLRLGTDYNPPDLETHFAFPEDHGSFSYAALRCVGVGKCRRQEVQGRTDVMCPSFLATHEEKHTTRGRARLLFEMLNGEETPDPWQNDDVKEALDLCLACKGCKNDCPVNVDMATYKAEFLSHYYEGRRRPRSAYAMGLIHWWARLASLMPRLANFFTQAPGISRLTKALGGVAQQRQMPPFTEETFKDWFARRDPRTEGRPRVMLWPDTFNNYFTPDVARAAVHVLEEAGYHVVVPQATLCCGRPLYDYGWLGLARQLWAEILETLRDEIRAGTPLVGLEPSCVAAFRDELHSFFPNNEDARRLAKQTKTLGEFLTSEHYRPPTLKRKAVVHGHCHHKSIMGFETEEEVMDRMGLDFEVVTSSCCGVAGSFGYEADKYDVSIACGEYALLPEVRAADPHTFVIANGFSCRGQVEQNTDRRPLHLAEVLYLAPRIDGAPPAAFPERQVSGRLAREDRPPNGSAGRSRGRVLALAAGAFLAAAAYAYGRNK